MHDTFSFDPSAGAIGSEILAEQHHALAAIATMATRFADGRWTDAPATALRELVETTCRCLPLAQHAGVVALRDGIYQLEGANDPAISAWVRAERAVGGGPLHEVLTGRTRVASSDELHADPRQRQLARLLATPTSIHSLLAVGLCHRGARVALALCSTWPFAFDDSARKYAEVLTAIYALAEQAAA